MNKDEPRNNKESKTTVTRIKQVKSKETSDHKQTLERKKYINK